MSEAGGKKRSGPEAVFDAGRRALFLESVRETCHFGRSAAAAGVSNVTVYKYRDRDAAFRQAYADALEDGVQRLHQKLIDEGIDRAGYERSFTEIARGNTWLARRLRALDVAGVAGLGGGAAPGSGSGRGRGCGRGRAFARTRADIEQSLLGKLSLLNRRMGAKD